jgi:glycosyltransferase involved in cell wall biosynthesis
VKLAWIGSASTLRGLERVRDLLDSLGRAFPRLALQVICDRSISLRHLRVEFRNWSEATEAADLADADIGMSWLPDDGWSAGKCGLKVLQYMAAGLPVIANPVGVQADLVRHGETGFLARTPEDWHDAVRCLMRDVDLRRQMGHAGRRRVEADFDVERGAEAWQALMGELASPAVTVNSD